MTSPTTTDAVVFQGSDAIACRFCCQTVSRKAKKCHHCGESLERKSTWRRHANQVLGWVGVVTTLLGLFYAAREGYYWIQERPSHASDVAIIPGRC